MANQMRKCVYPFCEALVELVMVPRHPDLPAHEMAKRMQQEHNLVHPLLGGPCPGSHMYVGFTPFDKTPQETIRAMDTMYQIHARQLPQLIMDENLRQARLNNPHFEHPDPESQSLRQPTRMGREPNPESEDWALGGREDEESGHLQQYAAQPPAMKPGIYGQQIGTPVSSVQDVLVRIQAASMKGGEAWTAASDASDRCQDALGTLQEVKAMVFAIAGDSEPQTLVEYVHVVDQAVNELLEAMIKIQEARAQINLAQEKGIQYGNQLLG